MTKLFHGLLMIGVVIYAPYSYAKTLTPQDVLQSSIMHFPEIQASRARIEVARGKTQEARGAYDAQLEGSTKARVDGYYDGDYNELKVVKPIRPFGMEVYTGYRNGTGEFPVYDSYYETTDTGEISLGAVVSLLRDRRIDAERFGIREAEIEEAVARQNLMLDKIKVQHAALKAYADWLAAGLKLSISDDLLDIAQKRQKILEEKAKHGEVAKIVLTENRQSIIKREAAMNEATMTFEQRSADLSLYLRDEAGKPSMPLKNQLPERFAPLDIPVVDDPENDAVTILRNRPEIVLLDQYMDKQRNKMAISRNALLPRLDLEVKVASDQGDGPDRLTEDEAIGQIKLKVPLQNNTGYGKVRQADAELRALEKDRELMIDKLEVELGNMLTYVQTLSENLSLYEKEASLARELQEAEVTFLENGNSNLFILTRREEAMAEARMKALEARAALFKGIASFRAARLDTDFLMIK